MIKIEKITIAFFALGAALMAGMLLTVKENTSQPGWEIPFYLFVFGVYALFTGGMCLLECMKIWDEKNYPSYTIASAVEERNAKRHTLHS